jgi:hypothetical protein
VYSGLLLPPVAVRIGVYVVVYERELESGVI